MIVSLYIEIYNISTDSYKSVFFQKFRLVPFLFFGIITGCRVDHHAKPGLGGLLFFGMLPMYIPNHYIEPVFGTYQIIIECQYLVQFMVLTEQILRDSIQNWTIIYKPAHSKRIKPVSGAVAQGYDVCSLQYKDDIQ